MLSLVLSCFRMATSRRLKFRRLPSTPPRQGRSTVMQSLAETETGSSRRFQQCYGADLVQSAGHTLSANGWAVSLQRSGQACA